MNNRIVIEIKDNKIVRQWNSINQASKELYLTRQTIMNYCNNKTKKKQIDLRWKEDKNDGKSYIYNKSRSNSKWN